jgi:hypothetical protein
MSLRFSLLGLVILTAFAALACAALARPDSSWLSLIVTITATAFAFQALRAVFLAAEQRAAAIGWLLGGGAYLAIVFAPWFEQHVAPQLLTSKGIQYAQVKWHSAAATQYLTTDQALGQVWMDPAFVTTGSPATMSLLIAGRTDSSSMSGHGVFTLSAHWLIAWITAVSGSWLAVCLHRRAQGPAAAQSASGSATNR